MGYHTEFNGSFEMSRPPTEKEQEYINNFANSRRMKRDPQKLYDEFKGKHGHPTPKDDTPIGIYGIDGSYFNLEDNAYSGGNIIDCNTPPGELQGWDNETRKINDARVKDGTAQPGLWCQWIIDGDEVQWDSGEKFYNYTEWIKYLIQHFFEPWGIKLNGEVYWDGDDAEDLGKIVITDNVVEEKLGKITFDYED